MIFSPPPHSQHRSLRQIGRIALSIAVVSLTACSEEKKTEKVEDNPVVYVPQVHKNQLPDDASSMISSQRVSPMNWQPWSSEIFAHAKNEQKTIFVLFGSGTDSSTQKILEKINASASTQQLLNTHHVNVLVDTNINKDLQFFASMLALKSGTNLESTMLVWFSYEGSPISWHPVGDGASRDIPALISRMSNTVTNIWKSTPEYVLENSRADFQRRMGTMLPPSGDRPTPTLEGAVRKLSSLFDPTSNSVDDLGRMHSAEYIHTIATASASAHLPSYLREKYIKNAVAVTEKLLLAGGIDPLDGGSFSGMQGTTKDLPVFIKTLTAQARTMMALDEMYRLTGDEKFLHASDGIRAYTKQHLALSDGGFAEGIVYSRTGVLNNTCVWTLEELEAALTAGELNVVKTAFGIRGLGNVPLEDDRKRAFFRKNTLTWKMSPNELAAQLSLGETECRDLMASAVKKLSKIRTERTPHAKTESITLTESLALLARAYTQAYRCTGQSAHLDQAIKLMLFIQKNMTTPDGELIRSRYQGKNSNSKPLAADYAQVCSASLAIYECVQDKSWLDYAYKLYTQVEKQYTDPDTGYLLENAYSLAPVKLKVVQFISILPSGNTHTGALMISNHRRLTNFGITGKLPQVAQGKEEEVAKLNYRVPMSGLAYISEKIQQKNATVFLKKPADSAALAAALRHHCLVIEVTEGTDYPLLPKGYQFPAGAIALVVDFQGKTIATANDVTTMTKALK